MIKKFEALQKLIKEGIERCGLLYVVVTKQDSAVEIALISGDITAVVELAASNTDIKQDIIVGMLKGMVKNTIPVGAWVRVVIEPNKEKKWEKATSYFIGGYNIATSSHRYNRDYVIFDSGSYFVIQYTKLIVIKSLQEFIQLWLRVLSGEESFIN